MNSSAPSLVAHNNMAMPLYFEPEMDQHQLCGQCASIVTIIVVPSSFAHVHLNGMSTMLFPVSLVPLDAFFDHNFQIAPSQPQPQPQPQLYCAPFSHIPPYPEGGPPPAYDNPNACPQDLPPAYNHSHQYGSDFGCSHQTNAGKGQLLQQELGSPASQQDRTSVKQQQQYSDQYSSQLYNAPPPSYDDAFTSKIPVHLPKPIHWEQPPPSYDDVLSMPKPTHWEQPPPHYNDVILQKPKLLPEQPTDSCKKDSQSRPDASNDSSNTTRLKMAWRFFKEMFVMGIKAMLPLFRSKR